MQAARVFGALFLALTLVFGSILAFMPLGEAGADQGNVRTTDTFSMFSKYHEQDPAGTKGDQTGGKNIAYSDAALDGTGGITYLRMMGPALLAGLVFVVLALVLTIVPKTSPTIVGGLLALPGALLILASVTLAVLATYMHSYDQIAPGSQVDWNMFSATLAVLATAGSTIAAGMGLVSTRGRVASGDGVAWEPEASEARHAGWIAGRNLRCPECSTVVTAGYGVVPICPSCNFGADYNGTAAPPVPARAVTSD